MEQKIKQVGIDIGGNIRRIRLQKGYGQTELEEFSTLQALSFVVSGIVWILLMMNYSAIHFIQNKRAYHYP